MKTKCFSFLLKTILKINIVNLYTPLHLNDNSNNENRSDKLKNCCNTGIFKWTATPVATSFQKSSAPINSNVNVVRESSGRRPVELNNRFDECEDFTEDLSNISSPPLCVLSPQECRTPRQLPQRRAKLNKSYAKK